jgi:hypothetical protein
MASQPSLIVEVPRGGAVDRQLSADPAPSVASGDVAVVRLPADAAGRLDAPDAGEVVLSVLSPEALVRERDEVERVVARAGTGDEPLVVVIEAAEELREDELAVIADAARRSRRSVILRVIADG